MISRNASYSSIAFGSDGAAAKLRCVHCADAHDHGQRTEARLARPGVHERFTGMLHEHVREAIDLGQTIAHAP